MDYEVTHKSYLAKLCLLRFCQ